MGGSSIIMIKKEAVSHVECGDGSHIFVCQLKIGNVGVLLHPFYVKDLGTMMMNVHYEACVHLHRVVQQIKDAGMKAAVTLNPSTPVAMLADIIRDVDMVLLMSVNPGFGGQKFIVHTLDKVRELRELITNTGSQALIEVDGGVNLETGRQLVEAGADVLVAGNAVFKAPDMSDMIHRLKSL